TIANNGHEAARFAASEAFDLILMDIQMPEMDGLEATRRIRAFESKGGQRVPIIAMTAQAMKGMRERCLSVGMDDYLVKPVRAQEIHDKIESLFSARFRLPTRPCPPTLMRPRSPRLPSTPHPDPPSTGRPR